MLASHRDDLFFYLLRLATWILGGVALELRQGRISANLKTGLPLEECTLTDVGLATGFGNTAARFPDFK